jgi:hypothetical protein
VATPISTIKPWLYLPVQIPGSRWGADAVRTNANSCAASPVAVGTRLTFASGSIPANGSLVAQGLQDLVNLDPGAYWDSTSGRVMGSCADLLTGRCASMSPRIIALGLYDPNDLAIQSHGTGATGVLVTNIIGAFVDSVSSTDVTVHFTRHPGQLNAAAATLYDDASFLRASMLVQ